MEKKLRLSIGILMILVGAGIFLWLLIRFFNQGYFGGNPRMFYLINLEMKDWFSIIIYSLLFALSGVFFVKNQMYALFLYQFIAIGLIIERFWFIASKLNDVVVMQFFIPILILFLCLLHLVLNQQNINYKAFGKRIGIIILSNLALISIGKLILPN